MTSKSLATSIRHKLLEISIRNKISYPSLETSFLIERLVARFVTDEILSSSLVFKGGFVALKVYDSPRFTVDIDAIIYRSNIDTILDLTKASSQKDIGDDVWFAYEEQVDLVAQGEYGGIRQVYRAGIGERLKDIKRAQIINFDIGIGEPVTPEPRKLEISSLLNIEKNLSWLVYPLEMIVAEKIHAIFSHGQTNSRSKDIYDLSIFLPRADSKILLTALRKCFEFRNTILPTNFSSYLKDLDTRILEKDWTNSVSSIQNAPQFKECFEVILTELNRIELN